jgi:glycosyltransferase involved in cell wall biosynthesis
MKVLWVMKEFAIGGAERLLLELAARMHGVDFLPVAVVDEPRNLRPYLEEAGMSPISLGARSPFDVTWLSRLRTLVKKERPDVVHVQNPYPAAGSRLGLLGLKVPLVYTEHSLWESHQGATRLANMATFWLNDTSVVVSDAVERSVAASAIGRFYASRLITIQNGIDPSSVRKEATKGTNVHVAVGSYGTVTHLNRSKAPDVLVAAAAMMRDRGCAADCYIVGSGSLAESLERQRRELGAQHVHLLGIRHDARAILGLLKVFVLPSRFEGLPMVLLEALALGVPIVATSVGGIAEVITHRHDGLLVPRDDPVALADAIQEVLQDEGLARDLARHGRELVETKLHIDTTATRLLSVYRRVAGT